MHHWVTGELEATDVSEQSASFQIVLALRSLRLSRLGMLPAIFASVFTSEITVHQVAPPPPSCRGHRVIAVPCVEHMFVIFVACMEVELRASLLTAGGKKKVLRPFES